MEKGSVVWQGSAGSGVQFVVGWHSAGAILSTPHPQGPPLLPGCPQGLVCSTSSDALVRGEVNQIPLFSYVSYSASVFLPLRCLSSLSCQ